MNQRLLGVVLCGGRSSRMGHDKAMLPHPSGGTFVTHAADRLAKICDQVCISGGTVEIAGVHRIDDPVRNRGPVVGIASALAYASHGGFQACMVTPVDMPDLTIEDLACLRQAWVNDSRLCCAVSRESNRPEPLVAIYPDDLRACLDELANSADRSLLRWIVKQEKTEVILSAASCRNVNSTEDIPHAGR